MIPMDKVRASQTPEARARDKKMMEAFMKRVPQNELREFWEKWKKERGRRMEEREGLNERRRTRHTVL